MHAFTTRYSISQSGNWDYGRSTTEGNAKNIG